MKNSLERFYRINIKVASAICGIMLIYLFLYQASIIQTDSHFSVIVPLFALLLFFIFHSVVKSQDKTYGLRRPSFIHREVFSVLPVLSLLICIIVLVVNLAAYPAGPIKANGNTYIDKSGNIHSYAEFKDFQKAELTLITVWSIGLLEAIVFLPFYDKKAQKRRFNN